MNEAKVRQGSNAEVGWKELDRVCVIATGKVGLVRYVYTNGFTLVQLPGQPVVGGILNNNSTYRNEELELVTSKI